MHHLIIGYGYCGYHLARHLLAQGQTVTSVSRHLDESMQLPGLEHICHDINQAFSWKKKKTILYYLIPPSDLSAQDDMLKQFLTTSSIQPSKIIYFSSSGVYGNHQGNWIDEQATCQLSYPRQHRRLDAEQQWSRFCTELGIPAIILRIAGIYGAHRLPVQAAIAKTPVLDLNQAPYVNHIYVHDLSHIAYQLAQKAEVSSIYNIADGRPSRLGTLQQQVALALGIEPAPYTTWEQIWATASPMKRELMNTSKRLRLDALHSKLGQVLPLTSLAEAIIDSLP